MTIYYKDGFFDDSYGGFVPRDAVEVSQDKYIELINGQAAGKQIVADKSGNPVLIEQQPSAGHELNLDTLQWVISPQKQTALLAAQRAEVRAKINAKRDECVNGGVYVSAIDKWIDSDDQGRSTLVEIKADFDLNGKDNTYTLICADNTAKTINFNEFKAAWDAAKNLKEKMFENAYMHKVLLEQSADPLNYDWSIGWATTYAESVKRGA